MKATTSTASPSRMRRARERLRYVVEVFSRTATRFDDLEGFRRGAAFSFYATFAIFPLLLLTVTVIGVVVGGDAETRARVLDALGAADPSVRTVIDQTLTSMQEGSAQKTSAIIGLLTLLFSASGAFVELDFTLNKIWQVAPRGGTGLVGRARAFVHERLVGFACVAGIGTFMLVSLVASSTLRAIARAAPFALIHPLLQAAEAVLSMALLSLAFAAAFHFIPRSRPPLRDVIGGAVLTTLMLTALEAVFALYLSHLTSYSAYGIVGGVLALATWIYLSSQIIFIGATLTRVHYEMTRLPVARARAAAPSAREHDASASPTPARREEDRHVTAE
jgi:membrane protein